jgi:hypothetical protein
MNESVFIKNIIININDFQKINSVLKAFLRLPWGPLAGGCARYV